MKYLVFVAVVSWVFLAIGCCFLKAELRNVKQQSERYKLNSLYLAEKLKREYLDNEKINQKKEQLDKTAIKERDIFDWNAKLPVDSDVIKQLRADGD